MPAFHQNFHNALSGAAQGEGIFGAGRNQTNPEAAAQRIQFVGNGNDLACEGGGYLILHAGRFVVIVNGFGYAFRFALRTGVQATDNTL